MNTESIEKIKILWNKKRTNILNVPDNDINIELQKIDNSWGYYKDKIINKQLSLDDFANTKNNPSAPTKDHGVYLMNFLERTSSYVYGSSKVAGSANNNGIKLNNDNQTYYINTKPPKMKANKRTAIEHFDKDIKPWLEDLLSCNKIDEKIKKVEIEGNKLIKSKQLLRKILVLDHPLELISIYQDKTINNLYKIFCNNDEEKSNLAKNKEIADELKKQLDITEKLDLMKLSYFLWEFINAKTIFDENNKNIILYGAPGTGKTYSVKKALEYIDINKSSNYKFIQFHPSYTYEDFIEGLKPNGIDDNGNIKFEFINGEFKQFCISANKKREEDFYFIIDEINRANLSNVFGELLLCLEYRDIIDDKNQNNTDNLVRTQYASLLDSLKNDDKKQKSYKTIDGKSYFGIPNNVHVIGMMNDVDRSIDAFDLALRRRFKWIRFECDYNVIENHLKEKQFKESDITKYKNACEKLNNYISSNNTNSLNLGKSFEFGHSFFMKISNITKKNIKAEKMKELFDSHLRSSLKEYLRAIFSENEIEGKNGKLSKALEIFTKEFRKDNEQE